MAFRTLVNKGQISQLMAPLKIRIISKSGAYGSTCRKKAATRPGARAAKIFEPSSGERNQVKDP